MYAIHFRLDIGPRVHQVGRHVVDGLLPAPAEHVKAGIDDQPRGAQRLLAEVAASDRPLTNRGPSRRRRARRRAPTLPQIR